MNNSLAPAAPKPASPEEVPTQFDAAFNRADVEAGLALFDESATTRTQHGQVVETDQAALRVAITQLLA